MRAFLVIVFVAMSVQAQSLADFARRERERQAHLKPTQVITGTGSGATAAPAAPAAQSAAPKTAEAKKPAADPVKEYNEQLDRLRAKIRSLQDEETATQLQINELNNQVYAPVVDQAEKDQALAVVGAAQLKLANVRMELAATTKELEAVETQGPPKSAK
jgi:TolA-binding protein